MPDATAKALRYLRESKKKHPRHLLHFTGAPGAGSILENKVLRLGRARSSNDPQELQYGLSIGRACLEEMPGKDDWTKLFKDEVRDCWDGKPFADRVRPIPDPHICCFSTGSVKNEKSIPMWSMYGHGGAGAVLVFAGSALARKKKVDLVRVVYKRSRQVAMMNTILKEGLDTCARARSSATQYGETSAHAMYRIVAHAFGALASMLAAVMKAPEFAFEDEWRLIGSYLPIDPKDETDQLRLSTHGSGHVVKSFFECPTETTDIKAVIVGAVASELNEPVIRMLLEHHKYEDVSIRPGQIALRRPL